MELGSTLKDYLITYNALYLNQHSTVPSLGNVDTDPLTIPLTIPKFINRKTVRTAMRKSLFELTQYLKGEADNLPN